MNTDIRYKNILVTGGAGFIGSNLCRKLINDGVSIWCLDNLITGKIENVKDLLHCERFHFIEQDIKTFDFKILPSDIDAIINLASIASPKAYYARPIDTLLTSVLGVYNLLQYAKKEDIVLLQASTSEVYGDPACDILNESYCGNVSCTGPRACYDEGKRTAETLCMDYHRLYNVKVKIIRIFNTYGPYMDICDGRAIPEFIYRSLHNRDLIIYGDGKQTRSFMYIDDLLEAIYNVMNLDDIYTYPINIGNPNEEYTISEVAETIIRTLDSKSKILYKEKLQDDPYKRKPDITKIITKTNWRPLVSLKEGLLKTIDYFENYDHSA